MYKSKAVRIAMGLTILQNEYGDAIEVFAYENSIIVIPPEDRIQSNIDLKMEESGWQKVEAGKRWEIKLPFYL